MTNYSEIDAAILKAIRTLPAPSFNPIFNRVRAHADAIVEKTFHAKTKDHLEAWRVVDRRLQSLRQKGKISYERKAGWTIVEDAAP